MADSVITIRPLHQAIGGAGAWTRVGGATDGGALSDDSDATYMNLATAVTLSGQNLNLYDMRCDPSTLTLPALAQFRSFRGRVRINSNNGPDTYTLEVVATKTGLNAYRYAQRDTLHPFGTSLVTESGSNFAPPIAPADLATNIWSWAVYTNVGTSFATAEATQVSEAYIDVFYNQAPTVSSIAITDAVGGVVSSLTPEVTWVYADPENDVQQYYQVAVWRKADTLVTGFDPFNVLANALTLDIHLVWGSGNASAPNHNGATGLASLATTVSSSAIAATIPPGFLKNGETYRAYVSVADVGSGGRMSAYSASTAYVEFITTIDPVLMPTITTLPADAVNAATGEDDGGVSFDPLTGQIDDITVRARSNLLSQIDASFETGAVGSAGSWVLTGGGAIAASTVHPYRGVGCARATADGTGTGHVILTSPFIPVTNYGTPGLSSGDGRGAVLLTGMIHISPVAAGGQDTAVSFKVRFHRLFFGDTVTSTVTATGYTSTTNNYKKFWIICPVPLDSIFASTGAIKEVSLQVDIGPCAASAQFDIDCAAITPFAFNLAENASFEEGAFHWGNAIGGSNTVTFGTQAQADEWDGGGLDVSIRYATAGQVGLVKGPFTKSNEVAFISADGVVQYIVSGSVRRTSGTITTATFALTKQAGTSASSVVVSTLSEDWQRFKSIHDVTALTHDGVYASYGATTAAATAYTFEVDDTAIEPWLLFVNGTMELGTNGAEIGFSYPMGLANATNLGWIYDKTADGTFSYIKYTTSPVFAGSLSLRLQIWPTTGTPQQCSQYFSVGGYAGLSGTIQAEWSNATFNGYIYQYSSGGVLVQRDTLFSKGGTQSTFANLAFAVDVHPDAAYGRIILDLAGAINTGALAFAIVDSVVINTSITFPVVIYGEAGKFGNAATRTVTTTANPLSTVPVTYNIGLGAGTAAQLLTSDGFVWYGSGPSSNNQLAPTADHGEIGYWDPDTLTTRQLLIPTSTGALTAVGPDYNDLRGGCDAFVLAKVTLSAVETVAWISTATYFGWDIAADGMYPMIGFCQEVSGNWAIVRSYTADQVYNSNPAGDVAGIFVENTAPNGTGTYRSTQGSVSMDFTPASKMAVIVNYFHLTGKRSGSITVIDAATGALKKTYQIPDYTDAFGNLVSALPRFVICDPSSSAGDERFVVIYDNFTTGTAPNRSPNSVMQEFSFNNATNVIAPMSVPITTDLNGPASWSTGNLANLSPLISMAAFDTSGNLFATVRATGGTGLLPLVDRGTAVYKKAAGERSYMSTASVATYPSYATDGHYAMRVKPDLYTPATSPSTFAVFAIDSTDHVIYNQGANAVLTKTTFDSGLAVGANLLSANDCSFETTTGDWAVLNSSCTIARSSTVAQIGTWSLKMTATAAGPMSIQTPTGTSGLAVTAGQSYMLSAYFRCDAGGSVPVQCQVTISWYDVNGTFISSLVSSANYGENVQTSVVASDAIGSWTQVYTCLDPPVSAAFMAATATVITTAAAEIHYLDNVILQTLPFVRSGVINVDSSDLSSCTVGIASNANVVVDAARHMVWTSGTQVSAEDIILGPWTTPTAHQAWLFNVDVTGSGTTVPGPAPWLDGGWSGGGLVSASFTSTVGLERSTDLTTWTMVRGPQDSTAKSSSTSPTLVPDEPYFETVFDDYEWPIEPRDEDEQTFYYRPVFWGERSGIVTGTQIGRQVAITPTTVLVLSEWLLIDPLDSANNYVLSVKSFKSETPESAQTYTAVGRDRRVVVGDVILGEHISLECFALTNATFEVLKTLVNQQATLVLRSPDGYSWYVRAVKRSAVRTWTGTYAQPLRTVTVDFEEVDPLP